MAWAFSDHDKSKVVVGLKRIITYTARNLEVPEFGTYLFSSTSTYDHVRRNCIVEAQPVIEDENFYHAISVGIRSIEQVGTKIKIHFYISDAGTNDEQFPLIIDVKFNVYEFSRSDE